VRVLTRSRRLLLTSFVDSLLLIINNISHRVAAIAIWLLSRTILPWSAPVLMIDSFRLPHLLLSPFPAVDH
jgi:hypothetical protein